MLVVLSILAWMSSLAPGRDHAANATAIASVILAERPLFADDEDRRKTAAFVVAIAFRESSFHNDAKSKTNDHCLLQVNGRPDLAEDPAKCVRVAMSMLRESFRMCPEHPLSFYAEGPRGCTSERAKRISNDRLALAKRLSKVQP